MVNSFFYVLVIIFTIVSFVFIYFIKVASDSNGERTKCKYLSLASLFLGLVEFFFYEIIYWGDQTNKLHVKSLFISLIDFYSPFLEILQFLCFILFGIGLFFYIKFDKYPNFSKKYAKKSILFIFLILSSLFFFYLILAMYCLLKK